MASLLSSVLFAALWRWRGWGGPGAPDHPWPNIVGRAPLAVTAGAVSIMLGLPWTAVVLSAVLGYLAVAMGWPGDVIRVQTREQIIGMAAACTLRMNILFGIPFILIDGAWIGVFAGTAMTVGYVVGRVLQDRGIVARAKPLSFFFGPSLALRDTLGGACAGAVVAIALA